VGLGSPRVGILGGAFNPPHLGHVTLARTAIERFALDRLLVRVVMDPGHKEVTTPAELRVLLARIAFADVDAAEVDADPHARTIDSLLELALEDPLFLIGADEFASFLSWKEPERILELARLGVATRPGVARSALDAVLAKLEHPERVELFEIDPLPISSSEIRRRVAAGEPIAGLVHPVVEREIGALGLYG
jgi:nicotinate-nucleotide adenylyltransferase